MVCLWFIDYQFIDLQFTNYFALQLLIASHKYFRESGDRAPVLAFSFRIWGLEYDVLVFSV